MTQINWGMAGNAQRGFQNALAQGMQMGAQARQAREEREYKNALAQFDPSNPETLTPVMQANPEVGLQLRGQVVEQQQQRALEDLTRRAISGDETALDELAVKNLPAWRALSSEQREAAAQQAEMFGNAAIDVLNRPPQERAQAIMGYAQRFQNPEIAQIAQLPANEQEQALRAAVAEAGMTQRLMSNEQPNYMVLPQGGTLVDTRNPQAVQQFGQGAPQGQPSQGQPSTMTAADFSRVLQAFGGDAAQAARYTQESNVAVQIASPEEADMLPPGTRIILNGRTGTVQ